MSSQPWFAQLMQEGLWFALGVMGGASAVIAIVLLLMHKMPDETDAEWWDRQA